jgi:hypothetical protein
VEGGSVKRVKGEKEGRREGVYRVEGGREKR